mgnify:CR=1 FL=1
MLEETIQRKSDIHIFGTGSMARVVEEKYHITSLSIDDLNQKLFPKFRSVKTQIYLQAQLRQEIYHGDYKHRQYLLNRLPSIVESALIIADYETEEISVTLKDSRKNEIIRLINVLLQEEIFKQYYNKKQQLSSKDISTILCGHTYLRTIYLYEIDYLNFYRIVFIHWLRFKGFNIEFRVPYMHEYPNTFRYWKEVYQVATKKEIKQCHALDTSHHTMGVRFALFNENNMVPNYVYDRNNLKLMSFSSPSDFYHYYTENNDDVFAVQPALVNQIVSKDESSLIFRDYIGKFIYYIQFCRKVDGHIHVNYDHFAELITSAWIHTSHASGIDALAYLKDLQHYMYGVKTLADIKKRLERLTELDLFSKTFDRENDKDVGRNYFKRYMLNPIRTFSFLHQEKYDVTINQLIELVTYLETVCERLLINEEETINVNAYFDRWKTFLETLDESEETKFWQEVFEERLPEHWSFSNEELLALIYLLASQKSKDKINHVYDISRFQEIIINHRKNRRLHVTNLTQFNFPEIHKTPISDFFNHRELKTFAKDVRESYRGIIYHALWVDYTVAKSFEELGIYQIYSMLAHYDGPIILSWIQHLQDDDMKSVYLDILADLYTNNQIKTYQRKKLTPVAWPAIETQSNTVINVNHLKNKIPDLYWLNHDFCSKKFFLTTFIDMQPIYNTESHQQLVFAKIGKLFGYSAETLKQFKELIFPLFPHWTYTKKENLIETEYKMSLGQYKDFENISYPKELKGIHVLRSVYRQNRRRKARNYYLRNKSHHEKDLLKQFQENINQFEVKAEPGNHCKMCPHLMSCKEGVYAIDIIGK